MKFKKLTEDTQDFTSCLNSRARLPVKIERWKNSLDSYIKKSFRKIKVRKNRLKKSAAFALIDKRNQLRKENQKTQEIEALDAQIAKILLKEEIDKAKVYIIHVVSNRKNAADDKLKQIMRRFADIH